MCLDNMISIQEWHFASSLDPNFMVRILGDQVKAGYTESKFACFGEFANKDARTEHLLFWYVCAQRYKLIINVEHFALNESKY